MHIIKGVHAGEHVTLALFRDGWITCTRYPQELLSPLMVKLESADEVEQFWDAPDCGTFWNLFELADDLTFIQKKNH